MRIPNCLRVPAFVAALFLAAPLRADPVQGDSLPQPLFPRDNWWNTDITWAPVDWRSNDFIYFLNRFQTLRLHPSLGGNWWEDAGRNYGYPYLAVDGWQPRVTVSFAFPSVSDGVGYPFYPIPDQAIWNNHWIEGGLPGYVDDRAEDRHMLIVDRDNNYLYELYNVWFDLSSWQWRAGSGAFWNMNTNDRRPDGMASADESGLAILPGVLRYEEVYGGDEIQHALRISIPEANGYVFPASNGTDWTPGALPFGARLRLRADKDISGYPWDVQKIFRGMKRYGLLVTTRSGAGFDNITVCGTYDTRWDNDVINPAFHSLNAWDFEVIELGWRP